MENDGYETHPLTAWDVAANAEHDVIVLRLHYLQDAHDPTEDAEPGPYVALSLPACLRLARDLLAAAQLLAGPKAERSELEGSSRERQDQ